MSKLLIDRNPLTGEEVWFEYDAANERMVITQTQDADVVKKIMDQAVMRANDGDYSKRGIKEDMWHYARLPNAILMKMKQDHGVDVFSGKPDWKKIFSLINSEYPAFKTTHKNHAGKNA